jgi:hypothetical protein
MPSPRTIFFILLAAVATACATGHTGDKTVAEYCADAKHANTDTCKVQVGVDVNTKEIASVRTLASDAGTKADAAMKAAEAANARQDGVFCETRTIRYSQTGACSAGYTLVSCTQSRYWAKAGGQSIMREIDDSQCKYATKILEMKVRCCMVGAQASPKSEPLEEGGRKKAEPATS